ncbi:hypothetical protein BFP72_08410 [Reichenbachiella sp. 5M10]|nr:hypothetical protein BFP72_08410 [Reichenbachiella sp. 5M10]
MSAFAQDTTESSPSSYTSDEPSFKNKNGVEVLPQAGDWSVGINATTALNYVGNIFTSTSNNNSAWWQYKGSVAPLVIQGKYFVSGTTAYRLGLNLNFHSSTDYYQVVDDNATSPDAYVEDVLKASRGGATILVGIEKRKGSGRVQGVYGADVYFSFASSTKYSYEYGNAITETNQTPSYSAPQYSTGTNTPSQGYRNSELKYSSNWGAGVQGFIGVEVFVFPKISLGGMFTWAVTYTNQGPEYVSEEAWDAQASKVEEYTVASDNGYDLNAGIGNMGGQVSLNFYF